MFDDLIEYKDLQEACAELFGFSGVTFKRDFGPWKKGYTTPDENSIWFKLEGEPLVKEQGTEGVIVNKCKFSLIAIV